MGHRRHLMWFWLAGCSAALQDEAGVDVCMAGVRLRCSSWGTWRCSRARTTLCPPTTPCAHHLLVNDVSPVALNAWQCRKVIRPDAGFLMILACSSHL